MTTHFIETFSGQPSKRSALIAPHSVTGQLCPAGNIGHLLLQAATTERGIVFVRDEHQETRYSYQTLLELARRRLTAFRQLGLKRGDPVMLMFRESADFVISFWAAVLGGMVPAPLAYPAAFHEDNAVLLKLKAVWEQMDRPLIVSDSLLAERQAEMQLALADQRFRVVVASDLAAVELAEPDMAGADDLALVQYSSGSTGQPKGVMLTHANLLTNLEGIIAGAQMTAEDAFISWMPYHHDMGLVGFHLTPMALGTEQINLMPFTFVRKPSLWLDKIHQHRARITGSPNFGYRHLLAKLKPQQLKSWDLSCLRLIFNGAEPISTTVIEDFMAALHPCGLKPSSMYTVFGMAEACLAVSFPPVGSVPRVHWLDRQALAKGQVVRVDPASSGALAMVDEGYPVPGCGIRIVDAEDRVLQEGQVGHVHIGGANVTAGYFRNPAATAACIRNGWLDTGDLGFMIDGRLCISGRHKDIIFVNGQNFYAHDIEAQMDNVAGIEPGKAAACGWQDAESGAERIALFIAMRRPDDGASLAVLKSAWQTINENLGITLDYVVPIKAIPKTTSGKIQRYKLVEDFLAGAFKDQVKTRAQLANVATVTPPTSSPDPVDMLNVVRSVWAEVLGIPMQALAVDRPYRALGGTSIKAVEILGLLEERLQRELNHELLLRCQTIQQMVDWLVGKPVPAEEIPMPVSSSAEAPIAIIGLSCRFPDSDSPEEFWAHINEGRELVGPIPQDRFSPPNGGREAWWRGGFIRDVYGFDAESFGISPEEATDMDPQQRVFLEVAAETLERAGYSRAALNGANVGMFIGASHNNHMEFLVNAMSGESLEDFASLRLMDAQTRAALLEEWQARFGRFAPHVNTAVDNLLNMIAARVSHTFNWKGPSLTVDSACSSSLVAVHLACQSLRLGECAMAIAGGVSLTLSHTPYLLFRRAGALSPSGRCRVFDAGADGFVLGEGAGAVLLKPLAQALADGDPVLAVIRGSAVNNDGQSLGVMAPNPDGQRRVIEAVYRQSGLSPASVQYVEAHGTGTPLGDPSEVRALAQVYA
ncbi:MAG: beta-ketoacyl synthase N-terminal-like domain-containing protein, partial [Methylococcales bacterium]